MSILIRDMEMPANCAECDFFGGFIMPDGIYTCDCPVETSHGRNITTAIEKDERPDWCPLVEVSIPHGRLIDIKSLENNKFETVESVLQRWWNGAIDSIIDNAPTVIEAEGETDGR